MTVQWVEQNERKPGLIPHYGISWDLVDREGNVRTKKSFGKTVPMRGGNGYGNRSQAEEVYQRKLDAGLNPKATITWIVGYAF